MNRPRESLLTLFDPLFSGDPTTPPPCRDVPSPDLGSDKENAAPASDSPITLTKFFNRIYTRPKAQQQPRPLPKGRLIDVGDANASYDNNSDNDVSGLDSDSDDVVRSEHVFVVHPRESLPTGKEEEREEEAVVRNASPRRPLVDIALGDSRSRGSSPIVIMKTASSSPSPSPFGSPPPFKLARPTPAPSSSPLASVINAINGTTSPSLTPSSSLTPSAPRIAVTPAEPSSPSPMRRQPRPGAMLHASPDADARRTSVDLQASLSVHFDESSFDLLKDKISLPENDSMGELDMDMGALTIKTPERTGHGRENVVMLSAGSESESDSELDCASLLEERLRDMKIEEDAVQQSRDEDGRDRISTPPPVQPSSCNLPTPQARQFVRPGNKTHVPSASLTSNAPPALLPKRGARASISGLPMPSSASTTTLWMAKKAPVPASAAAPLPGRKTAGGTKSSSHAAVAVAARSAPVPLQQSPPRRNIELRGVQRPPAPTKVVAPSIAASVRAQSQLPPQRNGQMTTQSQAPSKATVAAAALGTGLRPSGLRPPTSRASVSIAVPRRVSVSGGHGAAKPSMAAGGSVGAGRLGLGGSSGVARTGLVKGTVRRR